MFMIITLIIQVESILSQEFIVLVPRDPSLIILLFPFQFQMHSIQSYFSRA